MKHNNHEDNKVRETEMYHTSQLEIWSHRKNFLFNVITKCFQNPERLGKTKLHWNWIFLLKYYNPIRDYYFQSYLIQSKSRRNNKKHGKYTQGAILHMNKPKCLSKCGLGELNQVPWGCKSDEIGILTNRLKKLCALKIYIIWFRFYHECFTQYCIKYLSKFCLKLRPPMRDEVT